MDYGIWIYLLSLLALFVVLVVIRDRINRRAEEVRLYEALSHGRAERSWLLLIGFLLLIVFWLLTNQSNS